MTCCNCGRRIPVEDKETDWRCIWCPQRLCEGCYHRHTAEKHPKAYTVEGLSVAHVKRKEDYD